MDITKTIRIGTRGSKLALWQADYVATLLQQWHIKTEIVIIETKGDKILDQTLAKIGSKGLFTEEIEEQLRIGEIDMAVHSAKDLQASLPDDLEILAFTEREKANDVLVSYDSNFDLSRQNIVIGTSSTRRIAMLKAYYPHVKIVDMRGNLQTRMQKLKEGACDALILAYAGAARMGYQQYIVQHLPINTFTPAVGQGSIAVQVRKGIDSNTHSRLHNILSDTTAEVCLTAERMFLKKINGGCSVPVFGYAFNHNGKVLLNAGIISLDGKQIIRQTACFHQLSCQEYTTELAEKILQNGGAAILESIKQQR
jgi:hydroxymethylbilane synthase